jgi:O-methyltransferase
VRWLKLGAPRVRGDRTWDEDERLRARQIGTGDLDPSMLAIIERTRPYTLTSPERVAALCAGIDYVVRANLPGAIVECGVWRGGSLAAAALRLLELDERDRHLYAFDTFAGMTPSSAADVDFTGESWEAWEPPGVPDPGAGADDVRTLLESTGYPAERLHLVEGDVARTLPDRAPEQIALLRLDTDWYESTRIELTHLYPRLGVGGVLIVDDYGHYLGARKAVDDYFATHRIFLHRIDYTGRIAVKQHE